MTIDKRQILIVDDTADDIHFVMPSLADEYAVLVATNGVKALEVVENSPNIEVILMDVEMPEMDGYETCRRIKADPDHQDIDVIFVSAHNTVEERLAGYDAGGSDYLIKPVDPAELLQKVDISINNRAKSKAAAEQANALQTAMMAISNAGEQGVVLDFMRRCYSVETQEELARQLVASIANYQLDSSVQIRHAKGDINASSREPMPPLEIELMTLLKDSGRIMEKDKRLILNFGDISLLIKNLPDDSDKRGRLRDHLAMLLEGAEEQLKSLRMKETLSNIVTESRQSLREIEQMQTEQKQSSMEIMDELMKNLEEAFMSYGLTEEQEMILLQMVQASVDKSLENFEKGLKIDEKMSSIIQRLDHFSIA